MEGINPARLAFIESSSATTSHNSTPTYSNDQGRFGGRGRGRGRGGWGGRDTTRSGNDRGGRNAEGNGGRAKQPPKMTGTNAEMPIGGMRVFGGGAIGQKTGGDVVPTTAVGVPMPTANVTVDAPASSKKRRFDEGDVWEEAAKRVKIGEVDRGVQGASTKKERKAKRDEENKKAKKEKKRSSNMNAVEVVAKTSDLKADKVETPAETSATETKKSDKEARKAEKQARKVEKEAKKAAKAAEKEAKKLEKAAKKAKKEAKEKKKEVLITTKVPEEPVDTTSIPPETNPEKMKKSKKDKSEKEGKKDKKEKSESKSKKDKKDKDSKKEKKSKTTESEPAKPSSSTATAEQWNPTALSGPAERRDKFLRLLGAKKGGAEAVEVHGNNKGKSGKSFLDVEKMQGDLERQFEAGTRMKHGGAKRMGLGC